MAETKSNDGREDNRLQLMIDRFHYKVSLGYNCTMKFYIDSKYKQPTHYFDYIGSSAWLIFELLGNDFEGHVIKNNFQRTNPIPDTYLFSNICYNMRFPHDFPHNINYLKGIKPIMFQKFQEKYERRKTRFLEIIRDHDKPILFFRLDEPYVERRKSYGPISGVYPDPKLGKDAVGEFELDNFVQLTKLIKFKYNRCNFAVIYVSHTKPNLIDIDNNIIIIHNPKQIYWKDAAKMMNKIFIENQDFIIEGLTEILNRYGGQVDNTHT